MGAAISWMSVMQVCVTLSSAEAEMVAMTKMAQETIWFRRFIEEIMGDSIKVPTKLLCDNQAALALVDNRVHHARTKHIKLRQNFIREKKLSGELDPIYVGTQAQVADPLTKAVPSSILERFHRDITGLDLTLST